MLIDDGRYTHRVSQMQGPDELTPNATPQGSPWRGAFSVAMGLLDHPQVSFALDSGRDMTILPSPLRLPRPGSQPLQPAAEPGPEDDARRLLDSTRELAEQIATLGERASDARRELLDASEQAAHSARDRAERLIEAARAAHA